MARDAGVNRKLDRSEDWGYLWAGAEHGEIFGLQDDDGNVFAVVPACMIEDDDFINVVTRFMNSAISYGIEGYDPDYYIGLCVSGRCQLWAAINGAVMKAIVVTMKVEYSRFSVVRVLMCAGCPGSLETFGAMAWEAIYMLARVLGASKVEAWGRGGWQRALQKYARPEKTIHVFSYNVPQR